MRLDLYGFNAVLIPLPLPPSPVLLYNAIRTKSKSDGFDVLFAAIVIFSDSLLILTIISWNIKLG